MKISKIFIVGYILWGVFDICRSFKTFKKNEGCSVTREGCIFNAYCYNKFDVSLDSIYTENYITNDCENKIRIRDIEYLPLSVVLKGGRLNNFQDNRDYGVDYYDGISYILSPNAAIQSIDFSDNDYETMPDITNLINLKQLNMSHNHLNIAQLSNSVELDFLEEIDFAFNFIQSIEVLEEFDYRKLKTLNLSHNSITNIPDTIFHHFTNLQYLDLSNNRIININVATFIGLKNILSLNIGNNLIESIDSSLTKLTTLEELYLNDNEITKLLYADLYALTQIKYIDLSNNKIANVEENIFNNMPSLISLNLKNNHLKFVKKEMFTNVNGLSFIDLSYNEIKKLPSYLFKEKNITHFSIAGNNIEGSLVKGMFEGLRLIKNLDMSYQSITSIGDYAFFGIENISELLLNNNEIKLVSKKSFKLLAKLTRLDLSHNHISNITLDVEDLISLEFFSLASNELMYIKNNLLQLLNKLEYLDLSNNKILTIEAYSFQYQSNLEVLLIDKNPIQGNLEQNTFYGLLAVPSLDLSHSFLTYINNGSFDGMTHLHNINISHSTLLDLEYNSFINTGNLDTLDLSFNRLKHFNLNTTDLKNLRTLLLHNNLIKTLSENFGNSFVHLLKLDLSYNNLSFSNHVIFSDQKDLEYLDLSHNLNLVVEVALIRPIEKLKKLCLSSTKTNITFTRNDSVLSELEISNANIKNVSQLNLSNLKYLSNLVLSNNEVTKLQVGSFTNMSSLYSLDMSHNKIVYLQPGLFKGCDYLQILNISHNSLININYGALRGLSVLSILDISYNLIESLEVERFYELLSLTDLIVDHNHLTDVTVEDFNGLNLRKLSIGDNPLPCKALIRLKKNYDFDITAITIDDNSDHNYYGVTCVGNNEEQIEFQKNGTLNTNKDLKILLDIRNILRNNQNNTVQRDELSNKYLERLMSVSAKIENIIDNVTNIGKAGDSINTEIKQETVKTNSLLERILKVVVAKNYVETSVQTSKPSVDNTSNITTYLKGLRDLENSFIIEKEKIVSEFDDKILELSKRIDNTKLEVASQNNNWRNSTFTEVCVALILLILFCSIAFFVYKYKLRYIGSRSISTRQITADMENSNL